jgi:SAM-dependent methyltransferase
VRVDSCRACGAELRTTLVDLGVTSLANSYLRAEDLTRPEPAYPLRAVVCDACLLVQLDENADPGEIFSDYAYFSSYSESWLNHARQYAEDVIERFALDEQSQVIEIASNDGYLLKNFVVRGIPALGIEPAANVAGVARAAGIPTRTMFFDSRSARELAAEGLLADLAVANNVLAHVPALNDFVDAFKVILKPGGVITFEFPHLLRLIEERQFDTIYHEHFSYFSLIAVERLMARHALSVFDVQQLASHGGSLRLFVQHAGGPHRDSGAAAQVRALEEDAGLRLRGTYAAFGEAVEQVRADLIAFLHGARAAGKRVAGYGAPAKGNTLLNYCAVGPDLVSLTVDRNPHKQHRFLPGSHIPVHAPEVLRQIKPDFLLLLPWNLRDEIAEQMSWIGEWGGQFVTPVPTLTIWPAPHGMAT